MKKTKAKNSNTAELEQKKNAVIGNVGNVSGIQNDVVLDIGIDDDDPVFDYSEPAKSTIVESDVDNIFDNIVLSPKVDDKTIENLIDSSRGVSVDTIRFIQVLLSSKLSEIKEDGYWSLSLYVTTEDKSKLKSKAYDLYLRYTNPNFTCKWIKNMEYTDAIYNLKKVIDKFEEHLEKSLKMMGVIDEDNLILDKDQYLEIYKKCRLYFYETDMKEEFDADKINVFKNEGQPYKRKTSDLIDAGRELNWSFDVNVKIHKRITVEKIVDIYEKSLNIRFIDNPFTMLVS